MTLRPQPITQPTTRVTATRESVPEAVYTRVKVPGRVPTFLVKLVIVSNIADRDSETVVQVSVGVRKHNAATTGDWEPFMRPILNVGDTVSLSMSLFLEVGDEIVTAADVSDVSTVTLEVDSE